MLKKVIYSAKYAFGVKDMKKAFFDFLNLQAGAVYRGAPQTRQRKYINMEISQKFKQMQVKRKQERLTFAQRRRNLLQEKLSHEAKLLTQFQKNQLQKLNQQIKSLQTMIEQQNQQLAEIDKKLENTQAEYILIQGPKKLVILNQIIYLKHMNTHPSGNVLTPESVKVVQNIHYLVTHNLPVPRYRLYELMPDLFMRQIGQLEESVQRLIGQKSLNIFEQTTSHSIRQFTRNLRTRDERQYQLCKLTQQRQQLHVNMCLQAHDTMKQHQPLIRRVMRGQTPFRNMRHCITALTSSKLQLKLTQQQQAFKLTALQIMDNIQKFKSYSKQVSQRINQLKFSYIQPPIYIKNHPKLYQLWDKSMEQFTSPLNILDHPTYLPDKPHDDDGRAFMEKKLRKQVEKFDEEFVKLWNQDRSLLMAKKKETQIQFYNISTRILEEYNALEDKTQPIQEFKKLPKRPKRKEQKFVRITMDQLTKIIFLNKKDRKKYNLDFFSKYFGMEQPQARKDLFNMLNAISYLRVLAPTQDDQGKKEVTQQVIKFV